MTDKEKIRAEIERLKDVDVTEFPNTNWLKGRNFALVSLEVFIDSMQEEPTIPDIVDEHYWKMLGEEPVSEELEEAAHRCYKANDTFMDGFKKGANWQKEQFEKNRLKHCNSITNEQAKLEQGFIDQHLDKYNRMPTFLDAIEYGMRLQKQQIMKSAIDGEIKMSAPECEGHRGDFWIESRFLTPHEAHEFVGNDKIKIAIIKTTT